jgi:hypothetical protein
MSYTTTYEKPSDMRESLLGGESSRSCSSSALHEQEPSVVDWPLTCQMLEEQYYGAYGNATTSQKKKGRRKSQISEPHANVSTYSAREVWYLQRTFVEWRRSKQKLSKMSESVRSSPFSPFASSTPRKASFAFLDPQRDQRSVASRSTNASISDTQSTQLLLAWPLR